MTAAPTYVRASGVVAATVDGEVVLMAPTDGRCYALRGSAQAVWDELAAPHTVAALVETLTARFAVDPSRCADEVAALVAQLDQAGMVDTTAGSSA